MKKSNNATIDVAREQPVIERAEKIERKGVVIDKDMPSFTDAEMKDIRLVLMEGDNINLQSQLLQRRIADLQSQLIGLKNKAFAERDISHDDFDVNFQNLTIVRKKKD